MNKHAIIAGSSGLVGRELLSLLLNSEKYQKVYSLVRKPSGIIHEKLIEIEFDFNTIQSYESLPQASDIFCCLGTTIKKAGSKDAFKKVDYHFPVQLAMSCLKKQGQAFHVITALGSDSQSPIFYNKVKGELQDALKKLNFEQLYIYQPSLLVGDRKEERLGEKIAIKVMPFFELFMHGPLKKYKSIHVKNVARAMIYEAENENKKFKIILSDEIQKLADSHSNN